MRRSVAWTLVITLLFCSTLSAQDIGGVVNGKVKDSSYNIVLAGATVAVFRASDSMLLQFCIPDNFGSFSLSKLPFNDTLRMQITHVGYTQFEKIFVIRPGDSPLDFGWIYLHQEDLAQDAVVVTATIPPVRMNGDTLEFNPRAFKMKAEATAEDLMRRLPGFTIWSDGTITYNGKEIKALYVDGKPFMGGKDVTIATRNLPKEALDKVQVYQQYNEKNPLDSVMMANLKLKEEKKMRYFGKIGGGYGTGNRYAADAMLNGFNKKLQMGAVLATNNINKIASDIDVLLRNNSFKGGGNNIDYRSDFSLAGINQPAMGGILFQYDFLADAVLQRYERIKADYFIGQNTTLIEDSLIIRTLLAPDSLLVRRSGHSNSGFNTHQKFNSIYSKSERTRFFSISFDGSIDYNRTVNMGTDEQERIGSGIIGSGNTHVERRELSRSGIITAELIKRSDWYNSSYQHHNRIPTDFTIRYSFHVVNSKGNSRNQSAFIRFPANGQRQIQAFDRIYTKRDSKSEISTFNVEYPYLRQLIFGERRVGNIDIRLGGNFAFQHTHYDQIVSDLDTLSKDYKLNLQLTNTRRERITDLQPEIIISKKFQSNLTNRYSKYIMLEAKARLQHYAKIHDALIDALDFHYRYDRFTPQVEITGNHHRFGKSEIKLSLKFETNVNYPTFQQVSPLLDSTELWVIPGSNPHIRPEYINRYSLVGMIETRRSKNPWSLGFNFDYSHAEDKISDSSLYDKAGRMQVYAINMSGYRFYHAGLQLKKVFSKDTRQTFEFSSQYNLYRYVVPLYIDGAHIFYKSTAHRVTGHFAYTCRDVVNFRLQQEVYYYNNAQHGQTGIVFYSHVRNTSVEGTVSLFRPLLLESNVTYSYNAAQSQSAFEYTIWNASLTFRFLKGMQGEIKFSALDLLRQNRSVINISERNTQTFGYNNVLQQYFLLSISYYPRRFGN
jgi:hypothetical protein